MRSFRMNLSLPNDLHIELAEAELSGRRVQDLVREALYDRFMADGPRTAKLAELIERAFRAGATNEEVLEYARQTLDRPVSMATVTHYRWRLRRDDPSVPRDFEARRMGFDAEASEPEG